MPVLSSPTLSLTLVAGTSNVKVAASVKVSFDDPEETLMKLLSLKYKLRCRIYGEDGFFNGPDDSLFSIASKTITGDGTYKFAKTVNRSSLDEDWEGNDEIYAKFSGQTTSASFPFVTHPKQSDSITGNF